MDLGIRGKKVIITRATKGLGRAVVELLAAEGADIAFCGADAAEVKATAAALKSKQVSAEGTSVDVRNGEAYKSWLESAVQTLGGCDIFIANAEADEGAPNQSWKDGFDGDVMHTMRGCDAMLAHFKNAGSGTVVILGSGGPGSGSVAHAAMQAALITYSKQFSQFSGRHGVRCNLVSPDPKTSSPAEVAKTVVFLASPASMLVTGAYVTSGVAVQ